MEKATGSTQHDTAFSARENIVHYLGVERRRHRSMGKRECGRREDDHDWERGEATGRVGTGTGRVRADREGKRQRDEVKKEPTQADPKTYRAPPHPHRS